MCYTSDCPASHKRCRRVARDRECLLLPWFSGYGWVYLLVQAVIGTFAYHRIAAHNRGLIAFQDNTWLKYHDLTRNQQRGGIAGPTFASDRQWKMI
jgi:hypothetical protein